MTFGALTSDRVVLASGLDNQHVFTSLVWAFKTADTDFKRLWAKGNPGTAKRLLLGNLAGGNDLWMDVGRATTAAVVRTNAGFFPNNAWTYLAATYDGTDGPRVFVGNLTTAATEVTYATRTVGAGAETTDATSVWTIGNDTSVFASAFAGQIAFFAHYRRRFTLAEVVAYQFGAVPDADCDIYMHLGWNGTGTQANWGPLGTAINGTVTGATVSDHVPLAPPIWMGDTPIFAGEPAPVTPGPYIYRHLMRVAAS